MLDKPSPYKPCSVCHATLSALAIICPYCEEQLLPPDEPEGCLYGGAVLLDNIMPDADGFLDMVDDLHPDMGIYVEWMRNIKEVPLKERKRG